MTTFTLSYDLIKQKNYQALWDELERLGAHRTQDSYWLVNVTTSEAKVLHDHLRRYVDTDDRLWISELTRNHSYTNAKGGTNEWLAKNPPSR